MKPTEQTDSRFELQCMDIWSGYQSVENDVSTPGIDMFVYSRPYCGARRGGDVYYVSLCAGGVVTRLILADVSGHGESIAGTSQTLRALMRRFMNSKSQAGLVANLNREFTKLAQTGRFATAIVATYLSYRNRFTICNAGHPPPLWYRNASDTWRAVSLDDALNGTKANLPLGIDASVQYQQFELEVSTGDIVVLYTDALTEARSEDGKMLEQDGLIRLVSGISTNQVREFGSRLLHDLRDYCGNCRVEDDLSLLVLRFDVGRRRTPGIHEKLNAYAKLLGLKAT